MLSLKKAVVALHSTRHVVISNMSVLDGRGVGLMATNVTDVHLASIVSSLHGQQGIVMTSATDSSITGCSVSETGCGAVRAHGGDAAMLARGNLTVSNNSITRFALWKRTYQAGIHWAGVANSFTDNNVSNGPHNCFLGGGNEADPSSTLAGVDCLFEGNSLEGCAFEAADTGAFYVCGQMGSAFINRNNTIRNNMFRDIRNTVGTGVQSASVQGVYLDDQMSGWTIEDNRFINNQVGSFIGGGRDTVVQRNYYESCDTAQHIDDRGLGWQKTTCDCTLICEPLSPGCSCNTGGALWMLSKAAAAATWSARFPDLKNISGDRLCQPAHNVISDNTYCKCGKFIDAEHTQTSSWGTTVENNVEVTC